METRLGMEAALFYKVGGVGGAGSWTELTNVKDVTLNLEAGEADVTTRANEGWRAQIATLKEASVEFEQVWDVSDAGFTALKDAFMQNKPIGLRVLDANPADEGVTSAQGLEADFAITQFSRSEPLEEAIGVSVTAKITRSSTAPAWVTVTGS